MRLAAATHLYWTVSLAWNERHESRIQTVQVALDDLNSVMDSINLNRRLYALAEKLQNNVIKHGTKSHMVRTAQRQSNRKAES